MTEASFQEVGVETPRQFLKRWALSAGCVLILHGGIAAVAIWPQEQEPTGLPPAAILIELAPEITAPDVPQHEVAVNVQQDQSAASTESDQDDIEEKPPEPEPLAAAEPPDALLDVAELQEVAAADAVLEVPAKEVVPEPEAKEKQKPENPQKKLEKRKRKQKSAAQAASAPKPIDAARSKTNTAPNVGMGSSMSMATWRGRVVAHLNRRKRSAGGRRGKATVAFSINRSGQVLSARLVRSSGNAHLDKEAMALVRRASPMPPPPPNIKGNSVLLSVPVLVGS